MSLNAERRHLHDFVWFKVDRVATERETEGFIIISKRRKRVTQCIFNVEFSMS